MFMYMDAQNAGFHPTERGDTPLHKAVQSGHEGMVTLLLNNKADINKTCYHELCAGRTPLLIACTGWAGFASGGALPAAGGANIVCEYVMLFRISQILLACYMSITGASNTLATHRQHISNTLGTRQHVDGR